ncbi:MAG: dihydroorotase [Acidiferrobacteraceae bacterium]|nr:dihydroorotase [Acidiferrobacteraceae bacterium]|tara:strand:+ start:2312 stop:3595 length:1284 start_codon:yes stop_codon:yes gene_type:complete
MSVLIKGGRVIDPANNIDQIGDLFLSHGIVASLGEEPAGFSPDETIDARNLIVCPGLVDLQARLREPGEEHKATLETELTAAVAGGVTTVCCPPDTDPVIDTPAMVQMIKQKARAIGLAHVYPIGALTRNLAGQQLSDMAALGDAGCVAVGNADQSVDNTLLMRRAMQYAATFNLNVFLNALDPWLKGNGCVHEGEVSTRLGLPVIPEAAEVVALARELALLETTGASGHITQVSCARSVEKLAEAQTRKIAVTAAVSAHHLHLSEQDIGEFDTMCHVIPPLRSVQDRDSLRVALADGIIGAICSDHQPHRLDAKLAPFSESSPGISGLETLLSLALKLTEEQIVDLPRVITVLTAGPARILGIDAGHLSPGARANVCVFDPHIEWRVDATEFYSNGENTPFNGEILKGRVMFTVVDGSIVYRNRHH